MMIGRVAGGQEAATSICALQLQTLSLTEPAGRFASLRRAFEWRATPNYCRDKTGRSGPFSGYGRGPAFRGVHVGFRSSCRGAGQCARVARPPRLRLCRSTPPIWVLPGPKCMRGAMSRKFASYKGNFWVRTPRRRFALGFAVFLVEWVGFPCMSDLPTRRRKLWTCLKSRSA